MAKTQAEKEERTCTCGAGHGSGEGHTDWCEWLERRRKPRAPAPDLSRSPADDKPG